MRENKELEGVHNQRLASDSAATGPCPSAPPTLAQLEELARREWRERQEDCARFGADIPMPLIEVRVDTLVSLLATRRQSGELMRAAREFLLSPNLKSIRVDIPSAPDGMLDRHTCAFLLLLAVKDSAPERDQEERRSGDTQASGMNEHSNPEAK